MGTDMNDLVQEQLAIRIGDLDEGQRAELLAGVRRLLATVRDHDLADTAAASEGWTRETYATALRRLERENGWVQARCIEWAAQHDGVVEREDVYRIGNYPADRMLRGFTRPVNRVVSSMRAQGDLPAAAPDLLEPVYDHDVKADSFRVPPEIVQLLASGQ